VAHGLSAVPQLRVRLARGREHPRESIDVFFIVTAGGGGWEHLQRQRDGIDDVPST
jgi:hypothetical protein